MTKKSPLPSSSSPTATAAPKSLQHSNPVRQPMTQPLPTTSVPQPSKSTALNVEQQNWIDSNEKEDLRCLQRIQESWNDNGHYPNQSEVEQASRLAYKGHLTEVNYMKLISSELKSIPRFDLMAELTQIVKVGILIGGDSNIGPDNLSAILRNARCRALWIHNLSWNTSLT